MASVPLPVAPQAEHRRPRAVADRRGRIARDRLPLGGPYDLVSVADPETRTRDLLANERTFLAWLRTAATVMVLGLAIAKLVNEPGSKELAAGSILVVTGAFGVVEGARRYRRVMGEIERGEPMTAGGPLIAAGVLVAAILAALIPLLF